MQSIRNIAIIAHVDHGKTTLVDKLLLAGNLFREDKVEEVTTFLDNNALERERGITIVSKNVSILYKGIKINIIDTPGHADFGGEVERVLNMADGCLLLVDAFEGPMPQTRFVLQKALMLGLKPIVVVNKVDKQNARPLEVQDMVFDLMAGLNATDDQLDFVTLFGSAKEGWMSNDPAIRTDSIQPLLEAIIDQIPAPEVLEGPAQMLITSLDYSSYVGRIAVGRVHRGTLHEGDNIVILKRDGTVATQERIKELDSFEGLGRMRKESVSSGDICALIGLSGFEIGDTIADAAHPEALTTIKVDEPTMSMFFTINNSPFFGQDGKYVTSRHIHERLMLELDKNLALRVEKDPTSDGWTVFGRGVLHLGVLIETMRREGYELQIGQPEVIVKEIDGVKCEPIEELTINLPNETASKIIDMVTRRRGEMVSMESKEDRTFLVFSIPSRGIIGLNNAILTASQGEAVMAHRFVEYAPWRGDIERRTNGSIIASESGRVFAYALNNLRSRGRFFVAPGEEVYAGQVVGEHSKDNDIVVNVCKSKKLTNMRAAGSDEKIVLSPPVVFSLEDALEYIKQDEYVEVTPHSMRMRKIILDELERKRTLRNA
ncbi:translational GTPase TypA [Porphyromonas miyakawae]|uniref:Large ribosomal subunit assembly factor BipA n=1 Tax=Porphyromonas miyakawae TaxID=3137470 RepID=A0ABQ0E2U9_9PORP